MDREFARQIGVDGQMDQTLEGVRNFARMVTTYRRGLEDEDTPPDFILPLLLNFQAAMLIPRRPQSGEEAQ